MNITKDISWVKGIEFYYYYVCERKLWLFSKGISFENENDKVLQGKVAHEYSHQKEEGKELLLEDIKVDILNDLVKEFKISSSMKEASIMQLKYYLYYLKSIGIEKEGSIHYLKERKTEIIKLELKDEDIISDTISKINEIKEYPEPPKPIRKGICSKCAYFEFCFSGEVENE